jgi:ABC-type glycerol-3-phosphate transport system substrate-binding protein
MRKFAVLILILVSALGLSACGNANQSDTPAAETNTPESKTEQNRQKTLYQQTMAIIQR